MQRERVRGTNPKDVLESVAGAPPEFCWPRPEEIRRIVENGDRPAFRKLFRPRLAAYISKAYRACLDKPSFRGGTALASYFLKEKAGLSWSELDLEDLLAGKQRFRWFVRKGLIESFDRTRGFDAFRNYLSSSIRRFMIDEKRRHAARLVRVRGVRPKKSAAHKESSGWIDQEIRKIVDAARAQERKQLFLGAKEYLKDRLSSGLIFELDCLFSSLQGESNVSISRRHRPSSVQKVNATRDQEMETLSQFVRGHSRRGDSNG